ncbi:MAG: hypothetical protein BRD55_06960 [Bacteroidetes bacterium SW_9_63_38]|nr:MAG: hypothetical protein BRD55_06960 [Bacteroidetes bacterium SW_9_63_38]
MVFSFLYGFAARWHGWFPNRALEQASKQITAFTSTFSPKSALVHPRAYDRSGIRVERSREMASGLILLTSSWTGPGGLRPELRLLDRQGEVVHSWRIARTALFPDSAVGLRGASATRRNIHGSLLLPDGDILVTLNYVGTVRLDACGRVKWTYARGTHHSIAQAHDGSFWVPASGQKPSRTSPAHPDGFPGLDSPIYQEWLHHVSPEGHLIEKINVLDVLYANDLERYLAKVSQPEAGREGPTMKDILHVNDVEPLAPSMAEAFPEFEAGDLLVSIRNLHLVFVFDPRTRDVRWHVSAPLLQQHDPDFLPSGRVGMFDNNEDFTKRGTMLGGNRILFFNPEADSMTVQFPTAQSGPLYTESRGKWQQLPNGNMLITESNVGRVVEVAPSGRAVWEWVHPSDRQSTVPIVSKAAHHSLTREAVSDWPCSSVDGHRAE